MQKAIVITDDPNITTGNAKVCRYLCQGLEKLGYEIAHIVGWNGIGINKYKWPITTIDGTKQNHPDTGIKVQLLCNKIKPDVIVMHGDVWNFNYMPHIKTKALKVLYATVDFEPLNKSHKATFECMDSVIVTSSYGARVLNEQFDLCPEVIYEGVDTSIFYPLDEEGLNKVRDNLKKQAKANNLHVPEFFMAVLSRPIQRKNLPAAIRAVSKLSDIHENVGLISLYQTQGIKNAEHDMNEIHSRYLDPKTPKYVVEGICPSSTDVDDKTIASYLQAAHVLIHPCMAEGWGLPVLEAMACGVVPLVTNCTSMTDIVNDDNGYLVDVGGIICNPTNDEKNMEQYVISDKDLFDKLLHAYRNPEELKHKRDNAVKYARELSWDKTCLAIHKNIISTSLGYNRRLVSISI